jgi:cell division septation protein DedD
VATQGRLVAEASTAGDFRIQLGAFAAGEGAARRAWQTLSSRHADLLEGLTPRVDVLRKDGRNLWRLQAGPLTEARAKELCATLRARGASCLVAGP